MSESLRIQPDPTGEGMSCPPWCVRHFIADDAGNEVVHESAEAYFGDYECSGLEGVSVILEADLDARWPPRVNVFNAGNAELTPSDARRLAAHLLNLADAAEQTLEART